MRFLAVLELYKQGVIDLEQADSFGDLGRAGCTTASRARREPASPTGDEPSADDPTTSTSTSTTAHAGDRTVDRVTEHDGDRR